MIGRRGSRGGSRGASARVVVGLACASLLGLALGPAWEGRAAAEGRKAPAAAPGAALDIPMVAPRVTATLEETHVTFRVTPEDHPRLAYQVAIPKGWTLTRERGPAHPGPLRPQGLGSLAGSGRPGAPVIAVTVTDVPFEIPADAWARLNLTSEGWTIVSAKWFPGAAGLFFDITGTRTMKGVAEVRRTSVRVDGGHLLSVNCISSRAEWDGAKEIFWVAHDTFKLVKPSGESRMEAWLTARGKNPDFAVAHPASWTATPVAGAPEGLSAVDVRLMNAKQDTLLAYLQVQAVRLDAGQPAPSSGELTAKGAKRLASAGFKADGPLTPVPDDQDPRAASVEGWLGGVSGKGHLAKAEVTGRLGFVRRGNTVVTFLLLSPLLTDDNLVALRAQRAFEIARATFKLD